MFPLAVTNTPSLEFTFSESALVAAVVWRMVKTRVTLGNICRVLLNLIRRLIFVIFKDSSHSMFPQLTAASHPNFCSLALSVWIVS